jgi:hypothetical protein
MPAPHCSLSYRQEFERSVATRNHDWTNDLLARNVNAWLSLAHALEGHKAAVNDFAIESREREVLNDVKNMKSDNTGLLFRNTGVSGLLQTLAGRMKNIADVVLFLEALQNTYPDAAVPAKPFPIPQTYRIGL